MKFIIWLLKVMWQIHLRMNFLHLTQILMELYYMLASMKEFSPKSKFYFAGSSEMFGKTVETPQNENTKFYPRLLMVFPK